MAVKNDTFKEISVHIALHPYEYDSLNEYVTANGFKLRALIRNLLIKEMQEHNLLNELPEGYQLPKPEACRKKNKK